MKAFFTFVAKVFMALVAINLAVMAVLGFFGTLVAVIKAMVERKNNK